MYTIKFILETQLFKARVEIPIKTCIEFHSMCTNTCIRCTNFMLPFLCTKYTKCVQVGSSACSSIEEVPYCFPMSPVKCQGDTGSTLYSEGSFVRRFFSPKPFEVAMVRRTYGPKVLYSEVPLLRKLLCSEDSTFRKALHYMDSMLRRFFSPKFI